MMCMIDEETFFTFMKNMWIAHLCTSCHVTYDDSGLYHITNILKLVQVNSGSILVTKKGGICMKLKQVHGSTMMHVLWPVKYCIKAYVNLFFLICKFLQGSKISSDNKNNIIKEVAILS